MGVGTQKRWQKIMEINGAQVVVDMADQTNKFFAEIGPNLAANIPKSLLDMNYEFTSDREQFERVHTTEDEVAKLLQSIPNSKSTGLDTIPIRFLKLNLQVSSKIITHVINCSIDKLKVPSS